MDGVELEYRNGHRGAGLLFFNDRGDENGGLVYEGQLVNGVPEANSTIRFDHVRQQEAATSRSASLLGARWTTMRPCS